MLSERSRDIAIVAIGRNEGDRLKDCLRSAIGCAETVVYVDSGSCDGSPGFGRSVGCRVVELDPARPFSAARARNEGFAAAMEQAPGVQFVQFLDGDCSLAEGWLDEGVGGLNQRPDTAIVCGNVREMHPNTTIYNKLCDLEWRQMPGEVLSAGGRFLIRAEVFRAAGGFRADLIAGEDPEFCLRVRGLGWKILQVDAEMGRHDAAMTRFGEWWQRSRRSGHAFAQVAAMHGRGKERIFVRDCLSIWFWGLVLPTAGVGLAVFAHGLSLLALLCAYAMLFARIYIHGRRRGWSARDALVYAFFTVLGKFPGLQGIIEYHWRHWRGQPRTILEYRGSSSL